MKTKHTVTVEEAPADKIDLELNIKVAGAGSTEEAWQEIYDRVFVLGNFVSTEEEEQEEEAEEEPEEEPFLVEEPEEEEEENEPEEDIKINKDTTVEATGKKVFDKYKPLPAGYVDMEYCEAVTGYNKAKIGNLAFAQKFPKADAKHGVKNVWLRDTITQYLKDNKLGAHLVTANEPEKSNEEEPEEVDDTIYLYEVQKLTGLDTDTIDYLIEKGKFPKHVDRCEDGDKLWSRNATVKYVEERNARLPK